MSWVCPICSSNNDNENLRCSICDCERPYEEPKFDIQSQINNSKRTLFTKEKGEETSSSTKKKSPEPGLSIYNGLVVIDGIAMQYRGASKNVVFPDIPLKGINSHLFDDAEIETVIVPNDVQKIYTNAFHRCGKLKWVLFLGNIGSIEDNAFTDDHYNYPFLFFHQKQMPSSWGYDWRDYHFKPTWNVKDFYTDSYGDTFILYNDMTAALFSYDEESTDFCFNGLVNEKYKLVEIFQGAFQNHRNLKRVALPNTIKKIGVDAFRACRSLEDVLICEGADVRICSDAFSSCSSLKEFVIPKTVKYIESSAFIFCNPKLKIYIKTSTKKIPKGWDKNWNVKDIGIFNIYKRYRHRWIEDYL